MTNVKVDGKITLSENIADLIGVKTSYKVIMGVFVNKYK